MKTLKFTHKSAQEILSGKKTSTIRLFDDKELSVNDVVRIIDKVDEQHDSSWEIIGKATIDRVTEKRLKDLDSIDLNNNDPASVDDVVAYYRKFYGDRVNADTPAKVVNFSFEKGDLNMPISLPINKARLYTDGGSRGNPGPSACAYVICNMDDNVVEKSGIYLGQITNNQAEYKGLLEGLKRAVELNISELNVFMDSELVINQLNGVYKVKNPDLRPFYEQATSLSRNFLKISFAHVPRAMNSEADREVNRILDENK